MAKWLLAFCLALSMSAFAVEDNYKFNSETGRELYLELLQELRCPKCQNQNIADSNALVAKDMRAKVHQLVNEGNTKQEVVDYMIDRYGYFAHYKPPVNMATLVLWIAPVVFLVLMGLGVFLKARRTPSASGALSEEEQNKLNELLGDKDKS